LRLLTLVATATPDDRIVARFLHEELVRARTIAEASGVVMMDSTITFYRERITDETDALLHHSRAGQPIPAPKAMAATAMARDVCNG
jgi:hypothetical protein